MLFLQCCYNLTFNHLAFNNNKKQTGSFKDPVELPGLAHFCEHMLFLGTEKYPEEGKYQKVFNYFLEIYLNIDQLIVYNFKNIGNYYYTQLMIMY